MAAEHFCTLFDSNFLPSGLCLVESLQKYGRPFHLWILCLDEKVEWQLRELSIPNISLISLNELETEALRDVKSSRTVAEYCWTLTPFLPAFVLEKHSKVSRVTYVDADLYFFSDPKVILNELDDSNAHVLITEHAYDPKYEQSTASGRFCVQFVVFRNTRVALTILGWWQDRCLEWCYARHEEGKFGDQKYLERWPELFGEAVHILGEKHLALAPWNAEFYFLRFGKAFRPAFFHFHGLRLISDVQARLFSGYRIGVPAIELYKEYIGALRRARTLITTRSWFVPNFPEPRNFSFLLRMIRYRLTGRTQSARLE